MYSRAVLHPVGPQPARVYWLRRLMPLLILFVLVLVIAISCSGGSSAKRSTPATGTAATPTRTPTPTPTRATTSSPAPCGSGDLGVTAGTDTAKYPTGVLPRLVVRVRNTGLTACTFADAPSRRVWTV